MANLPDGEVFVAGRDKPRVVRLLAITSELGLDPRLVRTTSGGYVVPTAVADQYEKEVADAVKASEPKPAKAPTKAKAKATGTPKKSTSD